MILDLNICNLLLCHKQRVLMDINLHFFIYFSQKYVYCRDITYIIHI